MPSVVSDSTHLAHCLGGHRHVVHANAPFASLHSTQRLSVNQLSTTWLDQFLQRLVSNKTHLAHCLHGQRHIVHADAPFPRAGCVQQRRLRHETGRAAAARMGQNIRWTSEEEELDRTCQAMHMLRGVAGNLARLQFL